MKISEILTQDFIIPQLLGTQKKEVLEELCQFLEVKGTVRDKAALLNALIERERLGSTGIGESVAIPHGKSDEITKIVAVFGKSSKGIEFESLDQKPVHFVCLLLAPSSSTGLHLKALARISRLLKSQTLREEILKSQDAKTIYSMFLEEDSKFI